MNNPQNNKILTGPAAVKYIEKRLGYPLNVLETFPKFFLIETINVCNARCVMCGVNFRKQKKGIMSEELFDKIKNEIAEYKDHVEKVMLYLDGEPLLDRYLISRIKAVKEAGIKKVNIASNASLLNGKKAVELIDAGLDEVYITIDSLKKGIYEQIRKGLCFETVKNNILEFIKIRNQLNPKLSIRIQMVLQELNHEEKDDFIKYWTPLLAENDQVVVQKAHNWGSQIQTMKFGDENTVNRIPCIAIWGTFCIHMNGMAGLCCMDTDTTIPLGNIMQKSIKEIWNSKQLQAIRQKHISGERYTIPLCDGCTLWREDKHIYDNL